MKKVLIWICAIVLVFSLVGCGTSLDNENDNDENENKQYRPFIVIDITDSNLIVAEIGESGKAITTREYKIPNWFNGSNVDIKVGDKITVIHNGEITETEPAEFAEIYEMQYKDSHGCITSVIP
jgi:hypothetical protein